MQTVIQAFCHLRHQRSVSLALHFLLATSVVSGLVSCGSPVGAIRRPALIVPTAGSWTKSLSSQSREQLASALGTDPAKHDLDSVLGRYNSVPTKSVSPAMRLALAETAVIGARRAAASHAESGLAHWLQAAELAFPDVNHEGNLREIYNESCAQAGVAMKTLLAGRGATTVDGGSGLKTYRVSLSTAGRGTGNPADYDELTAASDLQLNGFRKHTILPGLGGALVATQNTTPERLKRNPFLLPMGTPVAVTVLLDFIGKGQASISYHQLNIAHQGRLAGRTVDLAADLTAPLATMMNAAPKKDFGLSALLNADKYENESGLFMLEPYRADKIPVVLVHGLMSKPATFKDTYNELIADPAIRERYQFWFFRYPTGWPIFRSAAKFRSELQKAGQLFGGGAGDANFNRMMLIGHSMGGIVSDYQIRQFGEGAWRQVSEKPLQQMHLDAEMKQTLQEAFFTDPPRPIKRVIFVATPHRGSTKAQGFLGKLGAMLVSAPKAMLQLQRPQILEGVTELGRAVLTRPLVSVMGLRADNPGLHMALSRPLKKGVIYHSIIGDRGKGDTPKSSDGFVAYESSHLDGAASELIVPSGHSAHENPEAIAEIRRILLLHMK